MKSITINDKEYELDYGIRFSKELSKMYYMEKAVEGNTIKFGLGVRMVIGYLENADADAISNVIKAALTKHKTKPSEDDILDTVDELAQENGGFDGVAENILDALRESGFYKKIFTEMDEEKKKDEADQESEK